MRRLLPLFALIALAGCGAEDDGGFVGNKAPDVTVETVTVPTAQASLKNKLGKVVVLDFWATWCGPCKQIAPFVQSLYEKHKESGLEVMAITNEAREIVALNEKREPHKVPVYLDPDSKANRAFGVTGLPTLVVIDRAGTIVFQQTGFGEGTQEEISAIVEKALETR